MQIQMDFFGKTPPGEATRYIVRRYTQQLVDTILKDLEEYSLKTNLKEKSLCQLYNVLLCVEDDIKPFSEKVLR
jgi:hypothetical protein